MPKSVVLVVGGDSFAARVAGIVRDHGNTVVLADPVASNDQVRTIIIDPASHNSIAAAFQATIDMYGRIDAVLAAFVPRPTPKGTVPGADQAALRDALDPTVRVAKCALYYSRRTKGAQSIGFLAISGPDVMAETAAGAIEGIFRSFISRFSAQSTHSAIVCSNVADEATAQALAACVRASDTPGPKASQKVLVMPDRLDAKMHIVKDGKVTTTTALQGVPHGFQYDKVFRRLSGLIVFSEDVTRWIIAGRVRALLIVGLLLIATAVLNKAGLLYKVKAALGL